MDEISYDYDCFYSDRIKRPKTDVLDNFEQIDALKMALPQEYNSVKTVFNKTKNENEVIKRPRSQSKDFENQLIEYTKQGTVFEKSQNDYHLAKTAFSNENAFEIRELIPLP